MFGQFDTPVSKIAMFSDNHYFLKKGDYQSRNTDDDALLPIFDQLLSRRGDRQPLCAASDGLARRLCERLNGEPPSVESPNMSWPAASLPIARLIVLSSRFITGLKQTGAPRLNCSISPITAFPI
ncbi:hypothetical protein M8494_01725 [Serratia ureilytica]